MAALLPSRLTRFRAASRLCFPHLCRHHSSLTHELIHNMDKKETWDRFYTENRSQSFRHFDWFFSYRAVSGFLLPFLSAGGPGDASRLVQVLDLGCGTSDIGLGLFRDSPVPVQVHCADISPVAIAMMQRQVSECRLEPRNSRSELRFLELDCSDLSGFDSHSVDLVLDKGTTDALLRSRDGGERASRMLCEALQVLRRSGSFLQFSDEDPDARIPWLESESGGAGRASVSVQGLGTHRGVCYYSYILTHRGVC
ncbi:citrate synthase-lysine N-methyltransferase CSKMT [Huso huso]|uniref:Citrate synthase-lysine N-methyltransferase CSKMT n=1 Tax=Huso huso TaxID=61971 RepID=A0ABR0YYM7_HUSHU